MPAVTLNKLQQQITELYDLPSGACVTDFVCDADVVTAVAGEGAARGEVLVVVDAGEASELGLYVAPEALSVLDAAPSAEWCERHFGEYCLAVEGVSHFVYVMFRSGHDLSVSQLELELQADVDKYAAGLLGSQLAADWLRGTAPLVGQGALQVALRDRSASLRARLFDGVRFLDDPGTERGARYRDAHRWAAKVVRRLEGQYVAEGDLRGLVTELRRFYRLDMETKVRVSEGR